MRSRESGGSGWVGYACHGLHVLKSHRLS